MSLQVKRKKQAPILQVKRKKQASILQQGSIFELSNLCLKDGATLQEFYPEVDFSSSKYGIVLSQSCDLYKSPKEGRDIEITHISIALLEPFHEFFQRKSEKDLEPFKIEVQVGAENYQFVDQESIDSKLTKEFERIFNNNHPWLFFIMLNQKTFYIVNLCKIVPLRRAHYDKIAEKVRFELKTEFADKLGWKIASFYGRVGTTDFTRKEQIKIATDLHADVFKSLSLTDPIRLTTKGFKEAKELVTMKNEAKKEDLLRKVLLKIHGGDPE